MHLEIERKFLVRSEDFKKESLQKTYIKQGFLNSHKERTVRIRIADDKATLTIKGLSSNNGTSRYEWEQELTRDDAENLMLLCEEGIIEKHRYHIPTGTHVFEVDEFLSENEGLVVAEIELNHESESFEKPFWLGREVTGDVKYYNAELSKNPFKNWNH